MVVLVLVLYMPLLVFDLLPLYKQKLWREFTAAACLSGISLLTAVLLALGVKLPSPALPIQQLVYAVTGR